MTSWVYKADTTRPEIAVGVTYWMNRLQNIPEHDPLFVPLTPSTPVRDHLIYDQTTFRHPIFDGPALSAQRKLKEMQGQNNTWFAGAYALAGDRAHVITTYEAHVAEVIDTVPKDRLLVHNLSDGWEPLCAHLGVSIPAEPYPSRNTTADLQKRMLSQGTSS